MQKHKNLLKGRVKSRVIEQRLPKPSEVGFSEFSLNPNIETHLGYGHHPLARWSRESGNIAKAFVEVKRKNKRKR